MSTTVTYKGQTLATVSNQTKTLLTEGKYLEDDITLEDVSGGGAVLGTKNITANGTYEAEDDSLDGYSEVTVAVPASAVDTGTKSITANGTHDVVGYASANVNVPNSYSAGDEGKVVSNGALVAQTAHADVTPTTSDQTIDTTTNDSIKVKGDADLVAGNIKKDVEIFGVTGSYEGGGGGISVDDLATNSAPTGTIRLTTATSIKESAFEQKPIQNVYAAVATTIYERAFRACKSLVDASFPSVTSLRWGNTYTFQESSVERIAMPVLNDTVTGNFAQAATNLQVVDLGTATSIAANAFAWASALNVVILRRSSVTELSNVSAFGQTKFDNGKAGGTIYVPSALIASYKAATNWSTLNGYGTVTWAALEGSPYESTGWLVI